MSRSGGLGRSLIVLLPILLLAQTCLIDAGASSNPKNLFNLYTNSPSDILNSSGSNQFQNEYQYRQIASKSASADRYKSPQPSNTGSIFDHISSDLNNAGLLDYSYQEGRGAVKHPECKGRVRFNGTHGFITDGTGYYETNLQCTWLIDSGRDNATIRLQFHQFETECSYDYLYIFDGDSIYSPLVAALSGDMKDFSETADESRLENAISNRTNISNNDTSTYSITNQAIYQSSTYGSRPFELKTESGKVFIYFHSDTAQTMPGFYITYTINSCPWDCSNRGECDFSTLLCRCNPGYYGDSCENVLCPNDCTSPLHGTCDKDKSCICKDGFSGLDCSSRSDLQSWTAEKNTDSNVMARAFHQAVVVDGLMWVLGGRVATFSNTNVNIHRRKKTTIATSYDVKGRKWTDTVLEGITGVDHLAEVTGHSIAAKGNKIFIYGGMALNNSVLDTLTVFDTKAQSFTNLPHNEGDTIKDAFDAPLAVTGHSANIIDGHMFVFLGYNPLYGYINFVQKFNLANNTWSFVDQKGSSIEGFIGHSSSYDSNSRLIYIYGGHNAQRSDNLYSFDPYSEVWTFLQAGPNSRYYHSAIILGKQLIVLGGNSYHTSRQSDQCFQQSYLTYDLSCTKSSSEYQELSGNSTVYKNVGCGSDCWQAFEDSKSSILKRHGHTVVKYDNELILYGGFNGMILGDLQFLQIGTCDALHSEADCIERKLGLTCRWNAIEMKCEDEVQSRINSVPTNTNCTKTEIKNLQQACESRDTCTDCLHTNLGCVWCGWLSNTRCHYNKCKSSNSKTFTDSQSCYKSESVKGLLGQTFKDTSDNRDLDHEYECKRQNNCFSCQARSFCNWQNGVCEETFPNIGLSHPTGIDEMGEVFNNNAILPRQSNSTRMQTQRIDPLNRSNLAAFTTSLLGSPNLTCEPPCFRRRSCNECTSTKCIWCSTSQQCIDSTAYFAYNSMGQCMHYVAHTTKCSTSTCSDLESCDKCLTNPKCGWLNDISNTGKGRCMEGTSKGPSLIGDSLPDEYKNTSLVVASIPNWYFSSCPLCQCNGHSYCRPNSSVCVQYCQDNTEGLYCDRCIPGYYGDPINGGTCRQCRCNGHAQYCNRETGKCYCSTKGIIGHNCNKCDDQNHYIGDPTSLSNGTCYYNLTTDYQYTFNMSKLEDFHYSDINFINVPFRKDSDVDFTIACSRLALVNISSGTSYSSRKIVHSGLDCGSFRLRFPQDKHTFSEANYSFFVHVYKFQTPFVLQIAFSQHRTLYLPQFFFTFSSCFLFLFALSGLIWKLKHEYDLYARRQRQFIEMEQMASRPFSTVQLELFKPSSDKDSKGRPKEKLPPEPTPISFEPCFGTNIGVLSLFVQLPGRPNLAIGSALVTLNDDVKNSCDDNNSCKQFIKDNNSPQNV